MSLISPVTSSAASIILSDPGTLETELKETCNWNVHYTVWIIHTATYHLLQLIVWYLSGNSLLMAASRRLTHRKKNIRLTAACKWLSHGVLNAFLIPIVTCQGGLLETPPRWHMTLFSKQQSHGRLQTAISPYIEQPPHSQPPAKYQSHTYPRTAAFLNGCLAMNSSGSYLAGGNYKILAF